MVHQTFLLSDDRRSICCVDRRETLRRSRDVVNVVSVVVDVVEDVDVTLSSGSLNYFTFFIRPLLSIPNLIYSVVASETTDRQTDISSSSHLFPLEDFL